MITPVFKFKENRLSALFFGGPFGVFEDVVSRTGLFELNFNMVANGIVSSFSVAFSVGEVFYPMTIFSVNEANVALSFILFGLLVAFFGFCNPFPAGNKIAPVFRTKEILPPLAVGEGLVFAPGGYYVVFVFQVSCF